MKIYAEKKPLREMAGMLAQPIPAEMQNDTVIAELRSDDTQDGRFQFIQLLKANPEAEVVSFFDLEGNTVTYLVYANRP